MSILNRDEIIQEYKNGFIICEPFNEKNVSTNSLDVCLGEHIFRQNSAMSSYNMYSKKSVEKFWIYEKASNFKELRYKYEKRCNKDLLNGKILLKNFDEEFSGTFTENDKLIFVDAGERFLGHTEEFVGSIKKFTTMMKSRSSSNRNGYTLCDCAGLGDCFFFSRWAMEITNKLNVPIILKVGTRVAQIVFFTISESNNNYIKNGKYQTTDNLKLLIDNWKPEDLLPKSYLDLEKIREEELRVV